jgi:hypothetical protein
LLSVRATSGVSGPRRGAPDLERAQVVILGLRVAIAAVEQHTEVVVRHRHVRVDLAVRVEDDRKRAPVVGLGGLVIAEVLADGAEVVVDRGQHRLRRRGVALVERQRLLVQRTRAAVVALAQVERREVVEQRAASGDVADAAREHGFGVVRPEPALLRLAERGAQDVHRGGRGVERDLVVVRGEPGPPGLGEGFGRLGRAVDVVLHVAEGQQRFGEDGWVVEPARGRSERRHLLEAPL